MPISEYLKQHREMLQGHALRANNKDSANHVIFDIIRGPRSNMIKEEQEDQDTIGYTKWLQDYRKHYEIEYDKKPSSCGTHV